MNIVNIRSEAIHIVVTDVDCMYDNGDQGSNLSLFNNVTIPPNGALPGGNGQYIEANASGSCLFQPSAFVLTVKDANSQAVIGDIVLVENNDSWGHGDEPPPSTIDVDVINDGQAHIWLTVNEFPPVTINRWILSCENRVANIWYNHDLTVYGLNPVAGAQDPSDANTVTLHHLGNGNIVLQCGGGHNAFASVRPDYGYQVQFQRPGAHWITAIGGNEILRPVLTGDGYFALYSPQWDRYVAINPMPDSKASNCNPLVASATAVGQAARFSATGLGHDSVFDFLQMSKSAYGLSFAGVDLIDRDLSNTNLSRCDFREATNFNGCTLNGANLQKATLAGLQLDTFRMQEADCTGADLTGCHVLGEHGGWEAAPPPILAQANLTRAQISAYLRGAKMAGALLIEAVLMPAGDFGTDLTGADLTGAMFTGADLTGCGLHNAILVDAHLEGVDLTQVGWIEGANFSGAHLNGAKLAGVDLTESNLAGTDFTGCDLTTVQFPFPLTRSTDPKHPTIFARCTLPYAVIGLDWSFLDLTSTTIVGLPTNLAGLNATSTILTGRDFTDFVLDRANFTNATLDQAVFTRASLQGSPTFAGASLMGAVFTGVVLNQIHFAGSQLGGVKATEAANFSFAYISNCDFMQANMFGVVLAGATLIGGNELQGATNLQEADFSDAYLPNADFTGANLQGAKFDGAFMVECVLTNADLTPAQQGAVPASLASACLQAAELQGTKLAGANLANAAITDARGQIIQQYRDADGKLTPPYAMRYPAGSFPTAASFSDQTVCPNASTYGTNLERGLTIAQMMTAPNPPTQWKPNDTQPVTRTQPRNSKPSLPAPTQGPSQRRSHDARRPDGTRRGPRGRPGG